MCQNGETGIVGQSRWIWLQSWKKEEEKAPVLVLFRKVLELEKAPVKCIVKVSADSRYKLYVNGNFVEAGPCKGNASLWYYDEIELAPYLKKGKNVIGSMVLRYPPARGKGNFSIFRTALPGFYIEPVDVPESWMTYSWKCKKAGGFRIIEENPYFAPLHIFERIHAEAENHGWRDEGFNDYDWEVVREISDENIPVVLRYDRMAKRPIPFLRRTKRIFSGVSNLVSSMYQQEDWEQFLKGVGRIVIPPETIECVEIDAGELMTGFLKLQLTGGKNAKISLLQSECYAGEIRKNQENPYKSLPQKTDRADAANGRLYGYSDIYYASGAGNRGEEEVYEPFWFRTFRYIRLTVETKEEPLELCCFDYDEVGYPLDIQTHVEISDPEMQKIWELCERTLQRCMHETYEDCPFYEQLQYVMDSRSQILYTYAISADDRLARKCMDDFRHSVRPDGMINCSYPNYEFNVIPGFAMYYVGMLYDHMMYFGDRAFLEKHLDTMEKVLDFFKRHLDERGIVGKIGGLNRQGSYWSFIDWTPEWDLTDGVPTATLQGAITMESLLYILGLRYGESIAKWLGKSELAKEYAECAEYVQAGVNCFCVGENGMYQDGPGVEMYSQHCQVFAILTGTVSLEKGRKILLETLTNKSRYAQCTVAMMFYLYRALEKCGLYGCTNGLWDIWRGMLADHMTTCAEDPLMSRSDCHGWGALALYEFPTAVLGVRPGKPGYEEIEVSPMCGRFIWAKGEVITPKGMVKVKWEKRGDGKIDILAEGPDGKVICRKAAKM